MLLHLLINRQGFEDFFNKHSIPLQGKITFPNKKASSLFSADAFKYNHMLGVFVLRALMTEQQASIETCFTSVDEAYDCYKYFTLGYCSKIRGIS